MNLYARWMNAWERRLTLKDPHRKIFPFDWGLGWVGGDAQDEERPLDFLKAYARDALTNSEAFFAPPTAPRFEVTGSRLRFETPAPGPYPENNQVVCRVFPAETKARAVIVVPQWNADATSHVGLCKIFARLGITAVRLTMPYHEMRTPDDLIRADYMVSPNLGRTLHAVRQAVLEVRQLVDWLQAEGYQHIGVMGTSLGSCVSYLAFVHDYRIETGVFNHVSSYFADVIWSGLSTRYVRWGLEGNVGLADLRDVWAPLSPAAFIERLKGHSRPHLMITADYDQTFPPALAELIFEQYRRHGLELKHVVLPCGHYTLAHFPYNYWDAWHICRFMGRNLPADGRPAVQGADVKA